MSLKTSLSRQISFDTKELAVCAVLFIAVAAVFGQSLYHGFINYDDDTYVYQNENVLNGWTAPGFIAAFTEGRGSTWAPMMWISLMTDSQFYGPIPSGYHFTNIMLHAITAIVLFLALRRMTSRLWPSAFIAAMFAIHPLRVESVAWVTERKDVLSGAFFSLTLLAYWSYARHAFSWRRYTVVAVLFALGLMAKPVLVVLPAVLLLLDYWPLGRFAKSQDSTDPDTTKICTFPFRYKKLSVPVLLILEKLPLCVLSLGAFMATMIVQGRQNIAAEHTTLWWRFGNAATAYVSYIGQLFWPVNLAPLYPRTSAAIPLWQVLASLTILAAVTAVAWIVRRRYPYILVGWLWYVVLLLPVIGLVQFGVQASADRFTYLPCIGLLMAMTWAVVDLWQQRPVVVRRLVPVAAMSVLLISAVCTWHQTSYWSNPKTLWTHTLECTTDNFVVHNNLGLVYFDSGNTDEAINQYRLALKINPKAEYAHNNLGTALKAKGRLEEAIKSLEKAVELAPKYLPAYNNLGCVYSMQGKYDQAIAYYNKVLDIEPGALDVIGNLAAVMSDSGKPQEAAKLYKNMLQLDPRNAVANNGLGEILFHDGKIGEALDCLSLAVQSNPNLISARNNLGDALAARGLIPQALFNYQIVLKIDPDNISARNNFAKYLGVEGLLGASAHQYKKVLKKYPDNTEALRGLAWLRATCAKSAIRNGDEALKLAQKAHKLAGGKRADVLDALAAAYAENGKFVEAVATARTALDLATEQKKTNLAGGLRDRIALYEAGRPYREALREEKEDQ